MLDLCDETDIDSLRVKVKSFCKDKPYLTACHYCNGRDYNSVQIKPAIQTKKPLPYKKFDAVLSISDEIKSL